MRFGISCKGSFLVFGMPNVENCGTFGTSVVDALRSQKKLRIVAKIVNFFYNPSILKKLLQGCSRIASYCINGFVIK